MIQPQTRTPRTLAPRSSVFLSPQSWDLIRRSFADGTSAPVLSARFGVARSTIYHRAMREGWRRRDLAAQAQPFVPADDPADLPDTPDGVATLCLRAIAAAVQAGRMQEALVLGRLIALLRRLGAAPVTPDAGLAAPPDMQEDPRAALERRIAALIQRGRE